MDSEEDMRVGLEHVDNNEKDKKILNEQKDPKLDETKGESDESKEIKSEQEPKEKVEMVEIAQKRLEELERAEAAALEEVKLERANVINYRKRLEKQRDEFAEFASARVLTKLLDVADDVNRILENGKEAIPEDHIEGIRLMRQRIKNIFDQENVTLLQIQEGKTRFDPRFHEPILVTPNADLPDKTILTVVNVGFIKNERVLRPAKVIITQKPKPDVVKEEATKTESAQASETSSNEGSNNNSNNNLENNKGE